MALPFLPESSRDTLVADLRYAWRGMRRSPAFYGAAVLMLALGIGLNAAMFSIFYSILLAPLQFPVSSQLYVVTSHAPSVGDANRLASGPDFRDYRDQNTAFTGVTAAIGHFSEVWVGDGPPRVVTCAGVTQSFFDVLGVRPVMGRTYTADEYKTLNDPTTVISWNFWKNQLGGDPHVIGRKINIGNATSEIVGVMPPMPDLYGDIDLWLKLTTEPAWPFMQWRANKFLDVIARVKSGTTRAVAEQQVTAILRRAPEEPKDVQARLIPLKDYVVGSVTRQVQIAMLAVALVLLVTCMNTAALLLCRAVKRSPEIAIRIGLGASYTRIRQQLLVESLALTSVGGIVGIALAGAVISLVQRGGLLRLPRTEMLHLNLPALSVSVALVIVVSIAIAAAMARSFATADFSTALRSGRVETGRAQRRPLATVVVAEIACAVVLTVCAGLLLRSFVNVQSLTLGYEPNRVFTAYLRTNFDDAKGFPFWRDILDRTSHVPGATASAVSDCLPGRRANVANITYGDRVNDPLHAPTGEGCWISSNYFRALGAPLLQGRFFADTDDATAPPVVLINAAAAKRLFPNEDAVGKRIGVDYIALGSRIKGPTRMREIVGIVGDLRQRAIDLPTEPAVYMPYEQDETFHVLNSMNLFVRAMGESPMSLAHDVQTAVQTKYPLQPVERARVLQEVVAGAVSRRRDTMALMTGFALLALVLCALGIYAVVSYSTLQRTREFGIRMALGATRGDVIRNVLAHGVTLVGIGAAVGLILSAFAARALTQLLFETKPVEPAAYAAAAVILAAVAIASCLSPGLRASRTDPAIALRAE